MTPKRLYTRGNNADRSARRILYRDGVPIAIAYYGGETAVDDLEILLKYANLGIEAQLAAEKSSVATQETPPGATISLLEAKAELEEIERRIYEAATGLEFNPSWINALRITSRQREEAGRQAIILLRRLLGMPENGG